MGNATDGSHLIEDPAALLQALIRFDTTNPPGNEGPCIDFVADHLRAAGISCERVGSETGRANLVARLPGCGKADPLLFYGHVDVVTAENQVWTHPPFEGLLENGWIWGRGALDMKGALAMMLAALARIHAAGDRPPGDILLALLADEEAGGKQGAQFLVRQRPDLFAGVRYAIGEFGGVPIHLDGKRFYMIQVAEKQPCWMEATVLGPAGHGSRPMREGSMSGLAGVLDRIHAWRSPIHITDVTRRMVEGLAGHLPLAKRLVFRQLLNPRMTDRILALLGELGRTLEPLFRHTVNATTVYGGEKANVIPSEITLGLDGRILPGFDLDDFLAEFRPILGPNAELDVLLHDPSPADVDYGLFDSLGGILKDLDPGAIVLPMLLPGSTDGRHLAHLGIQTYGFTPLSLPPGFDFFSTVHAADERVPVNALAFGTEAYARVMMGSGMDPS